MQVRRDAPLRLRGGDWTLWEHSMVRSAGFPVHGVLGLADQELAAAADALDGRIDAGFVRQWEEAARRIGRAVTDIARSDRFRLAVTWQNPQLIDAGIRPLLRQVDADAPRNRKRRLRERLIASYWQRYCLKNESIGFFGPTAWATVGGPDPVVSVRVDALVDRATVFLEAWSVDVLAAKLEEALEVGAWLCPRRAPFLRVTRHEVILPNGSATPIDEMTAAILSRADGSLLASDLVIAVRAECRGVSATKVYDLLRDLRRRRWLVWKLELPASVRAEDELRRILGRIDDATLRDLATGQVDRMIAARDRAQLVWDDPDALYDVLDHLGAEFTNLTGVSGTRNQGRTYGARTLAYLECRRGLSVHLGAAFVDALAPLSLLLDSVRWLTWQIRQALVPVVREACDRIVSRGTSRPNAAMLWFECMPLLERRLGGLVGAAVSEFHRRWRTVLRYDDEQSHADYSMSELRPAVAEAFDAPCSGWSEARWCSPDVMVAAGSAEEVCAGAFTLVLGELHTAMNALDYCSMVPHHPDPSELSRCVDRDFPSPRLLTALPKERPPRFTARSHPVLARASDYRLAMLPNTPLPVRERVRFSGDADIVDVDGWLSVAVSDADRFDVIDLFAEALKGVLLHHFELFPGDHRPRVTIDRLVIARESWTFTVDELVFAWQQAEIDQFVGARRWAQAHGLPRHAFVKSPVEMKPLYVDFASPLYVDLLVATIRRAAREATGDSPARLTVVEMLPTPDQVWLPDGNRDRYTSEFRLVAVDSRTNDGTLSRRVQQPSRRVRHSTKPV